MHINSSFLDFFRVPILRETTLIRVSPLFFLNNFRVGDLVHFYFGFGVILKIYLIKGGPVAMV